MKYDLYVVGESTPIATNIQSGYQYNPGDLVVRDYYIKSYNENGDTLDSNVDPGHAGEVQHRFEMLVTSPTKPGFDTRTSPISVIDNQNGTWTCLSDNTIEYFGMYYNKNSITKIFIMAAEDLTQLFWSNGYVATGSFLDCNNLTHFGSNHLPKLRGFAGAWRECVKLTYCDISGLTSAVYNTQAWYGCSSLLCLTELDSTGFTNKTDMFYRCNRLTAPNASEQAQLQSSNGFKYVNQNPCPAP